MTRWMLWLGAMAIGMLAAGLAPAAPAPPDTPKADEAKKPESFLTESELALMVRECKLSEDQQARLREAAAAATATAQEWQKTRGAKLEACQRAWAAARAAGDAAAMQKALNDAQPLLQERQALLTRVQRSIVAILTPEQQAAWQAFSLLRTVAAVFAKANLTSEQVATCKAMCTAAAKDILAIKGEGPETVKAQGAVVSKLLADVRDQVLTADQRGDPTKTPAGESGPAPAPVAPRPK